MKINKKNANYLQKQGAAHRAVQLMRAGLERMASNAPLQPGEKGFPRRMPTDLNPSPKRRLMRLSGKQNHRCCFCGGETTFDGFQLNTPRTEYIIPEIFGGTDHELNTVMACSACPSQPRDDYEMLVQYAEASIDEYLKEQYLLAQR